MNAIRRQSQAALALPEAARRYREARALCAVEALVLEEAMVLLGLAGQFWGPSAN